MSYPRKKHYLSSLSELLSSKVVTQAEAQVTKKLFPKRDFCRRLSLTHQRIKSSIEIRTHRYSKRNEPTQRKSLSILPQSHCCSSRVVPEPILEPRRTHSSIEPKRQFLRKGSSLQRQIVVNLVKGKLLRENPCQSTDILKLIQVYKGRPSARPLELKPSPLLEKSDRCLKPWQISDNDL